MNTIIKYNKIINNEENYLNDRKHFDINDLKIVSEIDTKENIIEQKIDNNCKKGSWSSCKTYITLSGLEALLDDEFEKKEGYI